MFVRIKQLLTPPVFEDEDKTRTAALLNTILWTLLAIMIGFFFSLLLNSPNIWPGITLIGSAFVLILSAIFLMQRGYVRLAGLLLSSLLWVLITSSVVVFGGVRASPINTYVVIILVAGLLMGGRAAIGFSALSILTGAVIFYAENKGFLPKPVYQLSPLESLVANSAVFILVAVLLHLATRSLTRALAQTQREITKRKQTETALKESRELLELFFSQSIDGFFFMILDEPVQWDGTIDKDQVLDHIFARLRVTKVNEAMLDIYGASREEFLKLTGNDLYARNVLEGKARLRGLYDKGRLHIEKEQKKFDGTPIWIEGDYICIYDKQGQITGHFGLTREITERKQTEQALRESEERFRQVITSISDHIYVTEVTKDGNHINLYISPNVQDLTGYPLEKFMTDRYFWPSVVIHPDNRAAAAAQSAKLDTGRNSKAEYRMTRADGQVIWVRDSARVESRDTSKIIYGVVSNITESKQLEEQLRQSQKMEAIGQLAGGVAHDFNNILTVIIGHCELILNSLSHNDPLRPDIEQIGQAGERAAALTRQLLAFGRQQMFQLTVLNLNTVIANMEQMLRRLIGEDVDLVTSLKPELGHIKADVGQIEQVIMNLAVNARDVMPQGGKLTIETANIELGEEYARQHMEVTPGPYAMLAISDTGHGMDAETQARIFEPFFTTKEVGEGTGLGLATVHGIVKQSSGHIWAYSESGQGTTFKIYLPQVEEAVETTKQKQAPAKSRRGLETILLVEDGDMVRELAHRTLLIDGYTVLEARNGREAVRVAKQHQGPIHLLLTDVVMPGGMSGRQLAEHLTPLRPAMKMLYMSGYTNNAIVHHGVLDSDTAFLQKPFTPDILTHKIRELLDTDQG